MSKNIPMTVGTYHLTRRSLLTNTALLVSSAVPLSRSFADATQLRPLSPRLLRHSATQLLPAVPSDVDFRKLALIVVDTARRAGADFADIRIGAQRSISVPALPYNPLIGMTVGYGIRARVNGCWGFQRGAVLTPGAVTAAATNAIISAKRSATINTRLRQTEASPLASTTPVTGSWAVPVEIDPFEVPIDDYYRVLGGLRDSMVPIYRNRTIGTLALGWNADTRVYASTEGTLLTQHFMQGGPGIGGGVSLPEASGDVVSIDLPGWENRSGGFERALVPGLIDQLMIGMDEATRLREIPLGPFDDVGRYPVVFEGAAFASLIGRTINQALDGDRVAGWEADAAGTSFLTPPLEILRSQTPPLSPLLSVSVDRAFPSVAAARWDDEGVPTGPYQVIDQGRIVDYHTTRESAPLLQKWDSAHGRPTHAKGGAIAPTPASLPCSGGGHVHTAPAKTPTDLLTLIRDISHGFVVRSASRVDASDTLRLGMASGNTVFEVRKGAIVGRTSIQIQFDTLALFSKKIVALGDINTLRTTISTIPKGMPWETITNPVTAPAALCQDVDVISWRRR